MLFDVYQNRADGSRVSELPEIIDSNGYLKVNMTKLEKYVHPSLYY